MDDSDTFGAAYAVPSLTRPLLGLTILVVEDSRYACEALRLLGLRSGARIRRADCLKSARRHLQVYRPTAIIVDLGLPDGTGADLIREMAAESPRIAAILGLSGNDTGEAEALAAGADGFLAKPVASLLAFQNAILSHLPADRRPRGPRAVNDEIVRPDPMAYRDDMAHVVDVLAEQGDERMLDYIAQFVAGVARSANDTPLLNAAEDLARSRAGGRPVTAETARIAGLVQDRLQQRQAI